MTKIIIRKTADGEYLGFTARGHAGFGRKGADIVCAALSVLTINTINSLTQLTPTRMTVESHEDHRGTGAAVISCRFDAALSEAGRLLMDSYVLGCREVFQNYGSKYLKLEFKEV